MSAPSMKERQACWEARDKLWKCLDENMEDASKCDESKCSFESLCPQQWHQGDDGYSTQVPGTVTGYMRANKLKPLKVKYFNRRREYLKYKATLEAGEYQPSVNTEKS